MGMSTQNMSGSGKGLSFTKRSTGEDPGPFPVKIRTIFTPEEREELKEIFREVMSEYGLIKLER